MRKLTYYFLIFLLQISFTAESATSSWERCESVDLRNIDSLYKKVEKKANYENIRNLWTALNCKYPGRTRNPSGQTRKLVVFLDGTWNDHKSVTNIWKLYKLAMENSKNNPVIPYYDRGVGSGKFDTIPGGLTGKGLSKNIRQAYRFLVEAYEPGDEIFLFGFSRGAYTARSLNGMIEYVGLLKESSFNNLKNKRFKVLVSDLYKGYHVARDKKESIETTIRRRIEKVIVKKKYTRRANKIEFWKPQVEVIGVFDTVACIGLIKCPFLSEKDIKRHHVDLYAKKGYHAISIDEIRKKFKLIPFKSVKDGSTLVKEFFAGAHSDIGGGYDSDYVGKKSCDSEIICNSKFAVDHHNVYYKGLETISLNWMIDNIKGENIIPDVKFPECPIGKIHNEFFKVSGVKEVELFEKFRQMMFGELLREAKNDNINPSVIKRWNSNCIFKAPDNYHTYPFEKTGKYRPNYLKGLPVFK